MHASKYNCRILEWAPKILDVKGLPPCFLQPPLSTFLRRASFRCNRLNLLLCIHVYFNGYMLACDSTTDRPNGKLFVRLRYLRERKPITTHDACSLAGIVFVWFCLVLALVCVSNLAFLPQCRDRVVILFFEGDQRLCL